MDDYDLSHTHSRGATTEPAVSPHHKDGSADAWDRPQQPAGDAAAGAHRTPLRREALDQHNSAERSGGRHAAPRVVFPAKADAEAAQPSRLSLIGSGSLAAARSPREELAAEATALYASVVEQPPAHAPALHPSGLRILPCQFPLFGNWCGNVAAAASTQVYRLSITEMRADGAYTGTHTTRGTESDVTVELNDYTLTIEDEDALLVGRLDPDWGTIDGTLQNKNSGAASGAHFRFFVRLEGEGRRDSATPDVVAPPQLPEQHHVHWRPSASPSRKPRRKRKEAEAPPASVARPRKEVPAAARRRPTRPRAASPPPATKDQLMASFASRTERFPHLTRKSYRSEQSTAAHPSSIEYSLRSQNGRLKR